MTDWYNPAPPDAPLRNPRRTPKRVVPSYIGESGQVGNWLFYMGAGDKLYDFSGEGNHGDLINDPEWVDGSYGWALDFDGADDYVVFPSLSTFSEFTVIVWSRHHSVNDGDQDVDVNDRLNNGFVLRDDGDGTYAIYIYDGSIWQSISTSISNDVWNMWTLRYDGSVMEGFKNAPPSFDSLTTAYDAKGSDNHAFGARAPDALSEYLDGEIALCWIYDVAKPDSFINKVFQRTRGLFGV